MHCGGCARGNSSELQRTSGVVHAEVSFTDKLARVAYDTNRVTLRALLNVIAEAGDAAQPTKPPKNRPPLRPRPPGGKPSSGGVNSWPP